MERVETKDFQFMEELAMGVTEKVLTALHLTLQCRIAQYQASRLQVGLYSRPYDKGLRREGRPSETWGK